MIAILTRVRDQAATIRQIVERIKDLDVAKREIAVEQLLVLASLRKLERKVKEELEKMPITLDIMDHEVIGPVIRHGLQQGGRRANRQSFEARPSSGSELSRPGRQSDYPQ